MLSFEGFSEINNNPWNNLSEVEKSDDKLFACDINKIQNISENLRCIQTFQNHFNLTYQSIFKYI